jgi:lysine-specific demethylase 8
MNVKTRPIERVKDLSAREFFERFAAVDRPVVIANGARAWPAVSRWNPEYLARRIGTVRTEFKRSSCHQHPDFHESTLARMFARETMSFSEFFDAITTGPLEERSRRLFTGDEHFVLRRREGKTTVDAALAPLLEDVEIPPLVPPERLYTVWAWFSAAGVRTWLHYDNNGCHNLNAQISGQKECLLFSPEELERLYPFPPGGTNPAHNCCAVDIDLPNFATHPRFAETTAEHAVIEAGDLLFIPAWWLHTFSHLGAFNSNINFWWKPERERDNLVSRWQASLDAELGTRHAAESVT